MHKAFLFFLFLLAILSAVIIGVRGASYYAASEQDRPFHPQYDSLKPSGFEGHGYGIVGTAMITLGVVMYSSRKRLRALAGLGRISYFLEFHIFLCLLGPVLVVYHTTFKIGGLVAVSFWSMMAVVLSGVVGRYFYVQIPKGIHGNELSMSDLHAENAKLGRVLLEQFGLTDNIVARIDAVAMPPRDVTRMSLMEVVTFFVLNDVTRRAKLHHLLRDLRRRGLKADTLERLRHLAIRRMVLTRRIAFLQQFKQVFHYWHVIHLPFSIIMFVILFVHVGVAIAFGYTWIW